jgi:hypothetical protein
VAHRIPGRVSLVALADRGIRGMGDRRRGPADRPSIGGEEDREICERRIMDDSLYEIKTGDNRVMIRIGDENVVELSPRGTVDLIEDLITGLEKVDPLRAERFGRRRSL